jgi:hypothetical protein
MSLCGESPARQPCGTSHPLFFASSAPASPQRGMRHPPRLPAGPAVAGDRLQHHRAARDSLRDHEPAARCARCTARLRCHLMRVIAPLTPYHAETLDSTQAPTLRPLLSSSYAVRRNQDPPVLPLRARGSSGCLSGMLIHCTHTRARGEGLFTARLMEKWFRRILLVFCRFSLPVLFLILCIEV